MGSGHCEPWLRSSHTPLVRVFASCAFRFPYTVVSMSFCTLASSSIPCLQSPPQPWHILGIRTERLWTDITADLSRCEWPINAIHNALNSGCPLSCFTRDCIEMLSFQVGCASPCLECAHLFKVRNGDRSFNPSIERRLLNGEVFCRRLCAYQTPRDVYPSHWC